MTSSWYGDDDPMRLGDIGDVAPPPSYGLDESADVTEDEDLLAPPSWGADDEPTDAQRQPSAISGGRGLVRIWLDDDGSLARVRVNDLWSPQSGFAPLEAAFAEAFQKMAVQKLEVVAQSLEEPGTEFDLEALQAEALEGFDPEATTLQDPSEVDDLLDQIEDNLRRWEERQREIGELPAAVATRTKASSGPVTVILDRFGGLAEVEFTPGWLEDATGVAIEKLVVRAARKALVSFVLRVSPEQEELESFRAEHDRLLNLVLNRGNGR
ncbi:hypothetical protein [Tessaracoccus sp. OH4464_COT-324]|uniref:hypothetical protein n=1 Tax=Tessaracoccus sp. OH4464_COT-324 TaxID=2491059 RepID=UPI000F63B321|nr:hypothetical protein [Tessaracoccus sp. OH4464_COT-324]RRD46951.1 hypothetical protein EII42_04440 [Tessaracoccus sp. OH4464_COT-324]